MDKKDHCVNATQKKESCRGRRRTMIEWKVNFDSISFFFTSMLISKEEDLCVFELCESEAGHVKTRAGTGSNFRVSGFAGSGFARTGFFGFKPGYLLRVFSSPFRPSLTLVFAMISFPYTPRYCQQRFFVLFTTESYRFERSVCF